MRRRPRQLLVLMAAVVVLGLAGVATAQATPGKTSRCSNCHSGAAIAVNAALTAQTPTSSTYAISAAGADAITVFNGTTKVGASIIGSSGSVTLPIGSTYSIFAVNGPGTSDGLGLLSVTPADVQLLPTSVSLATSTTVVPFGGTAVLRGGLLSGAALAGKPVILQYSRDGVTWLDSAITSTTDALGQFSMSAKPASKTFYRASFPGDTVYAPATSTGIAVAPKVSLTTPYAPLTATVGRSFLSSGYLKPRHTAGTYPVRLLCYRVESGKLVLRKTVLAKASNYLTYTKFAANVALPYRGSWKIRAYRPADSRYAATYSTYRSVTVR